MRRFVSKAFYLIIDVLLTVFFIAAICSLTLLIAMKLKGEQTVNLFGKEVRFVLTESMEENPQTDVSGFEIKSIRRRSLVVIERMPSGEENAESWLSDLEVGDVLTFRYGTLKDPITHRIIEIEEKAGGGYIFTMQGDNFAEGVAPLTQTIDTTLTTGVSQIIGKVVAVNYPLGVLVYALHLPVSLLLIIIIPCFVIIVLEIIHIAGILREEEEGESEEDLEEKQNKETAKKLRAWRSGREFKRNGYSYYGNANYCFMNCSSCEEKGDCPYAQSEQEGNGK